MREALLLMLALVSSCLGFTALALSMSRHWQDVGGGAELPLERAAALRGWGGAALAASLAIALLRDGPAFGSLLGILLLCTGAFAVALTLTWKPTWLRPLTQR